MPDATTTDSQADVAADEIRARMRQVAETLDRLQGFLDHFVQIEDAGDESLNPSQIRDLLEGLPRLTEKDIIDLELREFPCPICLNLFTAILAEEETAIAMDSPAHPIEDMGVTRLSQPWQCGHSFCRRDISKWILEAHASCPLCRRSFLEPQATQDGHTSLQIPENLASVLQGLTGLNSSSLPVQRSEAEDDGDIPSTLSGMYS